MRAPLRPDDAFAERQRRHGDAVKRAAFGPPTPQHVQWPVVIRDRALEAHILGLAGMPVSTRNLP
jgi:hypothetical protein